MKSIKLEKYNDKDIRLLVMDVDGTLTDGTINISANGELFKSFNVKDGYGINKILPVHKITPIIITGRISQIAEYRCQELGIKLLYQGVGDKVECLTKLSKEFEVPMSHIACIGDDLNDLDMMRICGVSGCPADAVLQVREVCSYVCNARGGQGAVREFIDWLVYQEA